MLKLNETPVRTSRNYNINNIKLEDVQLPKNINEFKNVHILGDTSKICIDNDRNNISLKYGLGDELTNQVNACANKNIQINLNKKLKEDIEITFKFDGKNRDLVEVIEINAEEKSKGTIIIKYEANKSAIAYHNGIIKVNAGKNADIKVIIANLLNEKSTNFISIENNLEEEAKVKYTTIDFGGKYSVTNYYSNLNGGLSDNRIDTIYLGKNNQVLDLNYICELRGEKSNVDIEVQGALKDKAKKNFKGTIDFKNGCKKATGNENESCMLLSKTAKSIALPMLLCSEEDVEGNHSSSAGKIDDKELFYIMSRGFSNKEAMKLLVRARFNKILESIKNERLKNQISYEIDQRFN